MNEGEERTIDRSKTIWGLPTALIYPFERIAAGLLTSDSTVDFLNPSGEPALLPPNSVSWQVFRNPVTMFIGGIAAVLLELGEPRVRSAVWDHSSFRRDPAARLRRTGSAAMVTVYGARSVMETMALRVRTMHSRLSGTTPMGIGYRADDPALLRWVQGTAAFTFLSAYRFYVRPVAGLDRDRYYAEGIEGAALYGVEDVAASEAMIDSMLDVMRPQLEPSPILGELIGLVRDAPVLPSALRGLQHMIIRAAVDLLPAAFSEQLGLARHGRLLLAEQMLLRGLARAADRAVFSASPATQACRRLGLPADYLLRL